MYDAYIIQSSETGLNYKGHTEDLEIRLHQHNTGKCKTTRSGSPWKLLYSEAFSTRKEAIERERFFKSLAGAKYLKQKLCGENHSS